MLFNSNNYLEAVGINSILGILVYNVKLPNLERWTKIGTPPKQHENGLYLMVLNFRKKKKKDNMRKL